MKYDNALGIAINQFLSSWDDELDNEQIIDALNEEDWDSVTIWQPFEDYDGAYVADKIVSLAKSIYEASNSDDELERDFAKVLINGSMTGA